MIKVRTASTTEIIARLMAISSSRICTLEYIANGRVWVLPGMLPATVIVAPNSLSALTNPNKTPAKTPRYASGTVIVKNTRTDPAPSVRADISYRSSTAPIATIVARAIRGNDTIAEAKTAATQVNTMSVPRTLSTIFPTSPSLPSSKRSKNPTTTGGTARGSETAMSMKRLPQTFLLTTSQATIIAMGKLIKVAKMATRRVSSNNAISKVFSGQLNIQHEFKLLFEPVV